MNVIANLKDGSSIQLIKLINNFQFYSLYECSIENIVAKVYDLSINVIFL